MGAESFIHEITARSAKEAFDMLIEIANEEYGTASYNGSINTCSMGRCKKKFDKYSKKNENEAYKYIDEVGNGDKWVADYIDLGPVKYEVATYKRVHQDGASKNYKMKYRVFKLNEDTREYSIPTSYYYNTKPEADKKSLELAIKEDAYYAVKKIYVPLDNKDLIVSEIVKETRTCKSKPNLKPMPERKIYEYHKYIFYGWASC